MILSISLSAARLRNSAPGKCSCNKSYCQDFLLYFGPHLLDKVTFLCHPHCSSRPDTDFAVWTETVVWKLLQKFSFSMTEFGEDEFSQPFSNSLCFPRFITQIEKNVTIWSKRSQVTKLLMQKYGFFLLYLNFQFWHYFSWGWVWLFIGKRQDLTLKCLN